jgi:phosphoribosyl-ATP pyrophosphohydrolase
MSDFLDKLIGVIADRKKNPKNGSYTVRLLQDSTHATRKVGEEALEVVIAGLAQSNQRLTEEMADLIYHCLVLLEAKGIKWEAVLAELERRHRP